MSATKRFACPSLAFLYPLMLSWFRDSGPFLLQSLTWGSPLLVFLLYACTYLATYHFVFLGNDDINIGDTWTTSLLKRSSDCTL